MATSCLFRVEEREIGGCSMGIRVNFLGAAKKVCQSIDAAISVK